MKDHFKENYRRMRQIQKESNQKDNEARQPVKALWKSTKYENVESKVKEELQVRKFQLSTGKNCQILTGSKVPGMFTTLL